MLLIVHRANLKNPSNSTAFFGSPKQLRHNYHHHHHYHRLMMAITIHLIYLITTDDSRMNNYRPALKWEQDLITLKYGRESNNYRQHKQQGPIKINPIKFWTKKKVKVFDNEWVAEIVKNVTERNTSFVEDINVPADLISSRSTATWGVDLEVMVYITSRVISYIFVDIRTLTEYMKEGHLILFLKASMRNRAHIFLRLEQSVQGFNVANMPSNYWA
jgi:hypothetical protein